MLPYPHNGIRYRHYGRILENMIKKAVDYPEGEEKKAADQPDCKPHEEMLPELEQRRGGGSENLG